MKTVFVNDLVAAGRVRETGVVLAAAGYASARRPNGAR